MDVRLAGGWPDPGFVALVGPAFAARSSVAQAFLGQRALLGDECLAILTDQSASEWEGNLRRSHLHLGPDARAHVQIIDLYSQATGATPEVRANTTYLSTVTDLAALGDALFPRLDAMQATGRRPVLLFDNVSTLVHYNDPPRVFRFLRELIARARHRGAVGFLDVEREEHDGRELSMISRLCQGQVELRTHHHEFELRLEGFGLPHASPWVRYEAGRVGFRLLGFMSENRIPASQGRGR